jgi:acetylornithine/succinyldiaminopimelate/putrescine aminotransferase
MSFIKHSDGKVLSIIEDEELTEDQKKTAETLQNELKNQKTESNMIEKTSGENLC